jgi:hypothetical protein
MPDRMPSLSDGKEIRDKDVDIKVIERRILSSTEHLNEIMTLNAILQVMLVSRLLMEGRPFERRAESG